MGPRVLLGKSLLGPETEEQQGGQGESRAGGGGTEESRRSEGGAGCRRTEGASLDWVGP